MCQFTHPKMKLTKINIQNFRCFDNFELELSKQVTVLIGKNGAGKSSFISAVRKSLSFIFDTNKTLFYKHISGVKGVRIESFGDFDSKYDWTENRYIPNIDIQVDATCRNIPILWSFSNERKGGKILTTKFNHAYREFTKLYKETEQHTLLAFYSDSYPHVGTKLSRYSSGMLESGKPIPAEFGYYQWNSETSCAEIWEIRLKNVLDNRKQAFFTLSEIAEQNKFHEENILKNIDIENAKVHIKQNEDIYQIVKPECDLLEKEITFISKALEEFTKGSDNRFQISKIEVTNRGNKKLLMFYFADGSKCSMNELPAGYNRLFSIVLDLAYRSFLLNYGNKETEKGLVMIDEIELHLHPSLQQDVIERFKRTFPRIQFIITTHSPIAISNFKQDENNKIIQLLHEDGKYTNNKIPNIFGIDYSASVRDAMGVASASHLLENLKVAYFIAIDRDDTKDAEAIYGKIKELAGADSKVLDEIELYKKLAEI